MSYATYTLKKNEWSPLGIVARVIIVIALLGIIYDLAGKAFRMSQSSQATPRSLSEVLKSMDGSKMTDKEQFIYANSFVGTRLITTKRGNSGVCLDVSTAVAQTREVLAFVAILTSTRRTPANDSPGKRQKESAQFDKKLFWNHFEEAVADDIVERFRKLGAKATRIDNDSTEDGHWRD